jgi:hypothetical protein
MHVFISKGSSMPRRFRNLLCAIRGGCVVFTLVADQAAAQIGRGGLLRRIRERAEERAEAAEEAALAAAKKERAEKKAALENERDAARRKQLAEQQRRLSGESNLNSQSRRPPANGGGGYGPKNLPTLIPTPRDLDPRRPGGSSATGRPFPSLPYQPLTTPDLQLNASDEALPFEIPNDAPKEVSLFGLTLDVNKRTGAIQVVKVKSKSDAAIAKLKTGDELVSLAGMKIEDLRILVGLDEAFRPGDQLPVEIIRRGKPQTLTLGYGVDAKDLRAPESFDEEIAEARAEQAREAGTKSPRTPANPNRRAGPLENSDDADWMSAESMPQMDRPPFSLSSSPSSGQRSLLAEDRSEIPREQRANPTFDFGPETIPSPRSGSELENSKNPATSAVPSSSGAPTATAGASERRIEQMMILITNQQKLIEQQAEEIAKLRNRVTRPKQ